METNREYFDRIMREGAVFTVEPCPHCGTLMSDTGTRCPGCGCRIALSAFEMGIGLFLLTGVLAGFWWLVR